MYGRRFFPYYTNTVVTGLDTDGKGCIFAFDPVGSMTKQLYACEGSAMPLILPILDAYVSLPAKILQVLSHIYLFIYLFIRFLVKTHQIQVKLNVQKKKQLK